MYFTGITATYSRERIKGVLANGHSLVEVSISPMPLTVIQVLSKVVEYKR